MKDQVFTFIENVVNYCIENKRSVLKWAGISLLIFLIFSFIIYPRLTTSGFKTNLNNQLQMINGNILINAEADVDANSFITVLFGGKKFDTVKVKVNDVTAKGADLTNADNYKVFSEGFKQLSGQTSNLEVALNNVVIGSLRDQSYTFNLEGSNIKVNEKGFVGEVIIGSNGVDDAIKGNPGIFTTFVSKAAAAETPVATPTQATPQTGATGTTGATTGTTGATTATPQVTATPAPTTTQATTTGGDASINVDGGAIKITVGEKSRTLKVAADGEVLKFSPEDGTAVSKALPTANSGMGIILDDLNVDNNGSKYTIKFAGRIKNPEGDGNKDVWMSISKSLEAGKMLIFSDYKATSSNSPAQTSVDPGDQKTRETLRSASNILSSLRNSRTNNWKDYASTQAIITALNAKNTTGLLFTDISSGTTGIMVKRYNANKVILSLQSSTGRAICAFSNDTVSGLIGAGTADACSI